jgi:EpsI family protein
MGAAALMAGAAAASAWLEGRMAASGATQVQGSLEALPLVLGEWSGRDVEPDERVVRQVAAETMIERMYTSASGATVYVHLAAFPSAKLKRPHPPEVCYRNAGWDVQTLETAAAQQGGEYSVLHCEKPGERVVVYSWYQMADRVAPDWGELRKAFREFRGSEGGRPPIVKVMLHASTLEGPEPARRALQDLAGRIEPWVRDFR